ncbi:pyridoxal 5'-phosphate synthase glutaminase subunit PdxT [Secundilactobacillus similis]|uniref:Pyridoxal 5'-phosphate synthase subunit PdxT n=1 Tax=Secundilactobacillus similis DSM 23365 = JCM 2765 TaxID=1423804 RepID=A0A0R2FF70_9LACO|nr:pyridoxal 5'-phosphate synthase glutaminase subunit PdxT [Secundilactobacillus similis]KRN26262.1 glutamine amidotransferase subunit PdxT [Secundilactobacillus similis DSM 23365 = JCM 2765]
MKIGVLALQGAVSEHLAQLQQCGVTGRPVKTPADLAGLDGLVLPGGESTTIRKLLVRENLLAPLQELVKQGFPIFGTCAGLVLLAQPESLNGIKGTMIRNGFGRQRESFEADINVAGWSKPFHGVFIRAPYFETVGDAAKPLATLPDGRIVAAVQGNILVTAFHPELTADHRFHQYFIDQLVKTAS